MSEHLPPSETNDHGADSAALLALFSMQLKGRRFVVEPTDGGALRVNEPDGDAAVTVTCAPRADDGDRPWFFCGGAPLAEADQPVTAMVAIRGTLANGGGAR